MKTLDKDIKNKVIEIDKELRLLRPKILELYSKVTDSMWDKREWVNSLHWLVMTKNSATIQFIDLVNSRFDDFKEYLSCWIKWLKVKAEEWEIKSAKYWENKKYLLKELFAYKELQNYIIKLLEKNFYEHYNERIRLKPSEELREIWFWDSNMFWGLFISPRFENGKWENDKSEMRRVNFEYWTIWHILSTWIINPDTNKIKNFSWLNDFIDFYENILRHLSKSDYEKAIYDKYIDYIKQSKNANDEPLLIPELRYWWLSSKHWHRLDFTIFNPYSEEYVWFELSPQSSHMSISWKDKKLVEHNKELKEKWEKEVAKRNDFFQRNKINIITFADSHLENIEECFNVIRKYLFYRKRESINIDEQIIDLLK